METVTGIFSSAKMLFEVQTNRKSVKKSIQVLLSKVATYVLFSF